MMVLLRHLRTGPMEARQRRCGMARSKPEAISRIQRFLINAAPAFSETDPITVIVDWRSAIAKH